MPVSATQVFATLIHRFHTGAPDAEVAREAAHFLPMMPAVVQPTCILIALLTHQRIGDISKAREFAMVLSRSARGADLPGIPREARDWAVVETKDLTQVIQCLSKLREGSSLMEGAVLDSLIRQYKDFYPERAPQG